MNALLEIFGNKKDLVIALAKREVQEKYLGHIFGVLWTIGYPILLIAIYVFIFTYVFSVRTSDFIDLPLNYTSYMLAGLVPWISLQESISNAPTIITKNASIVKHIQFPIEILPMVNVFAIVLTEIIFLSIVLSYNFITQKTVLWTYLLIPVLLIIQGVLMIGISLIVSAVGVYFRDLKEIIQVFLTAALFVLPILYLPEAIPSAVRPALYLNPFSYLIWSWQDILYFGEIVHPWAWLVLVAISLIAVFYGLRIFARLKLLFGNVL